MTPDHEDARDSLLSFSLRDPFARRRVSRGETGAITLMLSEDSAAEAAKRRSAAHPAPTHPAPPNSEIASLKLRGPSYAPNSVPHMRALLHRRARLQGQGQRLYRQTPRVS